MAMRDFQARQSPIPAPDTGERAWSVAGLARALADALQARFGAVLVRGEISGFTRAASGHCYFTLRDDAAQLRCVMFRQRAMLVDFALADGVQVEVRAVVSVYEPRGDLQLNVEAVRRAGQGALLEQFLRLKEKLRAEGLFDQARKRPLPSHPSAVGIVTSPQAAALRDVLVTLRRRSPQVRVILYPASVQGAGAPAELVRALGAAAARAEVDVLLLVRGGGALEDLWAFNDEQLARAIRASSVPVVSGVGHETDFTIADFAADLRAPTPTAAAELCAPALVDLRQILAGLDAARVAATRRVLAREQQRLDRLQLRLPTPARMLHRGALQLRDLAERLRGTVAAELQRRRQGLDARAARLGATPAKEFARRGAVLDALAWRFEAAATRARERRAAALDALARRLELLNPAATLQRGYCLAWQDDGTLLAQADALQPGATLVLATSRSAARLELAQVDAVPHPLATLLPTGMDKSP